MNKQNKWKIRKIFNESLPVRGISIIIWGCIPKPLTHCDAVTLYGNRSGSTLAQVMACCLTAPSHWLNQFRLLISEVLRLSIKSKFSVSAQATGIYNAFENYTFKMIAISPRGQWVKHFWILHVGTFGIVTFLFNVDLIHVVGYIMYMAS